MTVILLLSFVVFMLLLDHFWRRWERGRSAVTPAHAGAMHLPQLPMGVFLDPRHGWVKILADGTLRVGIDDLVGQAVGRVEVVKVLPVGAMIERGAPLVTLAIGGRSVEIPSPVSGEITAINAELVGNPALLAEDPYGLGWVVGLRVADHKDAIQPLYLGHGAVRFLQDEFQRFSEFLVTQTAGAHGLADGALPRKGALQELPAQGWSEFQRRFLSPMG